MSNQKLIDEKEKLSRRLFMGALIAAPVAMAAEGGEWIDLFNGQNLDGWTPSEHKASWTVKDGMLAADGPRSHLFYKGPVREANFTNFELEVVVTTRPECNSGVYFHTEYQETGFPEKGFEIQINNTARGEGDYAERKKTGSLYGLRNMYKQLVPDNKPFTIRTAVRGKNVQIRLNGVLLVDYVEPTPPVIPEGGEKHRQLDRGTFALQCHNDGSKAFFRSVRVRPLPDDLPAYTAPPPVADATYKDIINIGRHNLPMVDFHVCLRNGFTLGDALRKSRADGLQYGITAEASALNSDAAVGQWMRAAAGQPVFLGLSTTDNKWRSTISQQAAKQFDYILADCRVWTNENRVAIHLANQSEAETIADRQSFMDSLVDQCTSRFDNEPIDIYAHPTYLPATMESDRSSLWTQARIAKLIAALARNKIAIELNTVNHLPDFTFIRQAKEAGCKFAFGTANATAGELKRCEYGLSAVKACNLDWHNFFVPVLPNSRI